MTLTKKSHFFFCLALLVHLLLFLSFSLRFINRSESEKNLDKILPAYVYREEKNNPLPTPQPTENETHKETPTSKLGIEKPKMAKPSISKPTTASYSEGKGEQNINLQLKTKNAVDKPLLNLLSKATAAHLIYPKIAVDFRSKGTVTLSFTLSPNGQVTNIDLLRSSGSGILDNAAISAISAISPVKKVDVYLSEPQSIVVSISFV